MSLLNAWVSPDRALVAVDTDSITPEGNHYGISKLLPLAHANTLFAARGDRRFLHDLFARFYLGAGDVDYDKIIDALPGLLASVILGFRKAGAPPTDYQFAVVGWSPALGRMCGRWYTGDTGEDGYDEDELGARVAPWDAPDRPLVPDSQEAVIALAKRQVSWLKAKDTAGGGKLIVAEVTRNAVTIRRVTDLG